MSKNGMKLINVEDAVGHVLCHDMTQILPGGKDAEGNDLPRYKGARFRKGHIVQAEDVPVLRSMGKEHIYVWELHEGMLHEDDAARRMAALCLGENCVAPGEPREGKLNIKAACDGAFVLDSERLIAVNSVDQVMIATRRGGGAVHKGDSLAGTRVIPLVIEERLLEQAEAAAEVATRGPIMSVQPFRLKSAVIVATGSEVKSGLIEDKFSPVVEAKLAEFGIATTKVVKPGDDMDALVAAITDARESGADIVVCTGGMSVDPDDNTPGAIKRSGARIVTYGAPVLPGAMLCLGYFDGVYGAAGETPAGGMPIIGLPGCVMYSKTTVFDLALPRLAAGVALSKRDFVLMGEGGLLGVK